MSGPSLLHIIGGALLILVSVFMLANLDNMETALESLGIPPLLLVAGTALLCTVTVASGIGMWLGTSWGWWLMAFYYVYGIFRNAMAVVTVVMLTGQLELGDREPEYHMMKHGVRVVIQALLLMYCFKGNVLSYFGLADLHKLKALGIVTAICVALSAVSFAISYLYS